MKVPKGFKQVTKGVVKKGDWLDFGNGEHAKADGLIGEDIAIGLMPTTKVFRCYGKAKKNKSCKRNV